MKNIIIILFMFFIVATCYKSYADIQTAGEYLPGVTHRILQQDGSWKYYDKGTEVSEALYQDALLVEADEAKDFTKKADPMLKAFALTVLDEINALRTNAGLAERTTAQLVQAVKNKYTA